jgi:hypothetical protein
MLFASVAAATTLVGVAAGQSGLVASAATHPRELTGDAPVTVVANGLREPKSLAWGSHGHLLVSEAGTPPPACMGSGFDTTCYGLTGSVADVSSGRPVRIVEGLASNFNEQEMVGPNGLAYAGGRVYTLETGSPPAVPSGLPADLAAKLKKQYGAVLDVTGRSVSAVANPGQADYEWAQAHQDIETNVAANPYALVAKRGGGFYLVDAAANTLDSVDRWGHVHVLAFIPKSEGGSDGVPTCVDVGRDGAVYVGEITGHGNSATAANVFRYTPWGGLKVWQSGFSAINGCGFGANGDFYVTELDTTGFLPTGDPDGVVIQIGHDGKRTVLGAGKLFAPGGFLAGRDGSVYVVNKSIMWPACTDAPACTGAAQDDGEVVKIG